LISSLAVVASLITAQAMGRYIDTKEGRNLLQASSVINALLHLLRPLISTFVGALSLNVINEVVTTGYRMPYYKGMYDASDDLPGFRIAYVVVMEATANFAQAWMYWILAILAGFLSAKSVLSGAFMIGAIASILIMTERYVALRRKVQNVT